MTDTLAFVRLQQLISPTLPIGAFTYSQGMEWAVECGWLKNADDVHDWLYCLLFDSLAWLELPLLLRLYNACSNGDHDSFCHYAAVAVAGRETSELRREDAQRAQALLAVLKRLPSASEWPLFSQWQTALQGTALAGFALACQQWHIPLQQALTGYLWGWLDNQVCVAVKLVPLGQTDGQRLLYQLAGNLDAVYQCASQVADEELGASTPALAIASSLHETQYCRLFRS